VRAFQTRDAHLSRLFPNSLLRQHPRSLVAAFVFTNKRLLQIAGRKSLRRLDLYSCSIIDTPTGACMNTVPLLHGLATALPATLQALRIRINANGRVAMLPFHLHPEISTLRQSLTELDLEQASLSAASFGVAAILGFSALATLRLSECSLDDRHLARVCAELCAPQ
jgi:hypothetical protein